MLKLDSLFKHVGRCKSKVSKARIKVGSFYFDLKNAQNEKNYIAMDRHSILDLVVVEVPNTINKNSSNLMLFFIYCPGVEL